MKDLLEEGYGEYDKKEQLLAQSYRSVAGYHTNIAHGVRVHPTRESLNYAVCLLDVGGTEEVARAGDIIRKIVSLQDTDPFSPTYGIWSWFYEEPLDEMSPPDANWADFLGAMMAGILRHHRSLLPEDLVADVRSALKHAAWSIFRRNINLEYTNIAIMGGGVTAVAGELLKEPPLLEFGRERLRRVVELANHHGTFPEYNSPTYTHVALTEAERILDLIDDSATRQHAHALCRIAWTCIASHFHPATQQWVGAQSRAYDNYVRKPVAAYLTSRTGVTITPHPSLQHRPSGPTISISPVPCPEDLCPEFADPIEEPHQFITHFVARDENARNSRYPYGDRIGTTWMDREAAVSSVNHEDMWTQRRVVTAYWHTEEDPAACLRLRFLHDGRDFASAFVRNRQQGPHVLSAFTLVINRGDFHPFFGIPEDHLFPATDFRLRYELTAAGARAEKAGENRFVLTAGNHSAVIHTAPGRFGQYDVKWEHGEDGPCVYVDGICYAGPERKFNLAELGTVQLAAAMELKEGAPATDAGEVAVTEPEAGAYSVTWRDLSLDIPGPVDEYPT